jgi:hypothetical protein
VPCAALLCGFSLITGCLAFLPKVNITRYTVDDTPANREAVAKCLTSVGNECGMNVSIDKSNHTVCWNYSVNGGLMEYFERAEFGFRVSDINNLQSLALRLKSLNDGDEVSKYVRSHLSPSTLDLLSSYNGGTNVPLLKSLIHDLNSVVILNGLIYETNRFKAVKLSASTSELLFQKPEGYNLYKVNRMLLDASYPEDIRPMGPDQIVVEFLLKAKVKSKGYLERDARLTREMKAVFGGAVRTCSYAYWLP